MIDKVAQSRVAVAALLHDIGKFRERAYGGNEKQLSQEAINAGREMLTRKQGLWTFDFFQIDFASMIANLNGKFWKEFPLDEIKTLSAGSYNPHTREEKIIARADSYSRGFDISEETDEEPVVISTPLKSLISSIKNKDGKNDAYYSLKKLTSVDSIIPQKEVSLTAHDYKVQYDAFLNELGNAVKVIADWETLIRKLKDLLLEYTWCIPASTNPAYCDISLYDHSVTTMSIALALLMNEKEDTLLRVCAFGISGIQSFIFQSKFASFRNAAKIFRGRSFIVAFFSTAFEKYLSSSLGLIPFFDVMDAGGNITLILPDNDGIEEKLKECQREIETFLLEKYHATLSIVMDYSLVIPIEEFGRGKYKELRKKIGKSLNRQKSCKFSLALGGRASVIDEVQLEGGLCPACGKHDKKRKEDDALCPLCEGQKKLGGDLPGREDKKKYLVLSEVNNGGYEIFKGYYLAVYEDNRFPQGSSIWTLGKEEDAYPYWRINNYSSGKMFEEIADEAVDEGGRGKRFLSYVKIDVDSLGSLINEGMDESEYSVSRFSTLSRTLHHFFNMHVYSLLSRKFKDAYTVLSGGDDLFVILPWNQALLFVSMLSSDFKAFAAGNKEMHFSAGIVLSRPKEPFALLNERANEALDEKAKKVDGKNAVSLFGETFSLTQLDDFLKDCDKFKSFIVTDENKNAPLSSGFVYRLYQYVTDILSDSEKEGNILRSYGTYSRIHYDVARNINSDKCDKQLCSEALKFILDRFNNYEKFDDIKMFKLLLIKTMYELRITEIENKERKDGNKTY